MPDVTRTDSQRSDTSLRPRVSFNRDVHVKRIVPREGSRPVGALSADGEGHLIRSHVRKERLTKNKHQLAEEAARVLTQVDRIECQSADNGSYPEKYHTLPARRKVKLPPEVSSSLDRKARRRNSADQVQPPKKPPRTFASPHAHNTLQHPARPKKPSLRRSVSDAAGLKGENELHHHRQKTAIDGEDASTLRHHNKKQLSPIIEVTQREDYFTPTLKLSTSFKENDKNVDNDARAPARRKKPAQHSVIQASRDDHLASGSTPHASAGINRIRYASPKPEARIKNQVVVIDVDKATKIENAKDSKLSAAAIGRKLKSFASKTTGSKKKAKSKPTSHSKSVIAPVTSTPRQNSLPALEAEFNNDTSLVQDAIDSIASRQHQTEMIHSSQQPVERLPLTRGRTVDTMVKKLSYNGSSPPPKTNVMITPNVSVQHNNNQPFSYTRGVSPDRSPTSPTSPIIYAQVVCGTNGTGGKQTVHTAYTGKKHLPHSDSDEGLGYEEHTGFRSEKGTTHFGDDKYNNVKGNYYNDTHDSRFEEEYPITPKFQTNGYNGFHYDSKISKMDHGIFIDSSSRGRGDGMDSKRRESLTETFENESGGKLVTNNTATVGGGRKDLTARRELLESRITRRFEEKRGSPEYSPKPIYITETTSRYYRSGSASPIGGRDKHISATKIEGKKSQTKKYRSGFDNEPKSFDSQASDYRSSPDSRHFETSHRNAHAHHNKYVAKSEKQQLTKDRNFYTSNPEIHLRAYNYDDHRRFHDSYHDSLTRRESERKDKFGDSGIENDIRTASGERRKRGQMSNDSEDEGFASSLLIASERQHTEDNFARRNRRGYDSDRGYAKDDDYKNLETMEYRKYKQDYAPRERSIDDGSHFDPRIDKLLYAERRGVKVDNKPPKSEKKSNLEKVKQLFTSKKKKEKQAMVREESLRARYTEYKGTPEPSFRIGTGPSSQTSYDNRRRVSPTSSPTREGQRKTAPLHSSWFKSLDRLSRKKNKKSEQDGNITSTEDDITKPTKSLRFFGDTDQESTDSVPHKSALKLRSGLTTRHRSQSTRDLHNISEESHKHHKSMLNIHSESNKDMKGSRTNLKPPVSPLHPIREPPKQREDRSRRRKNEVSSIESSTEGDSSQQSQRSVVYLHAATVGDIPRPGYLRNGRRAASREEIASNASSRIQPHVKTLSRSFSVLAPWKPRYQQEGMDIDYTQYPKPMKNGKYEQNRSGSSRRESSTLKKKAVESSRSSKNTSTLGNKKSRSKENISTLKRGEVKSSSSSLYKKKERQPKEHNRYNREDKRIASKSMSVESLGSNRSGSRKGEVSRSVSIPRDPEKSAGWFNMTKKNKKSLSTHRL